MAPMNWLFKEEPSHYSFDELVKDKKTVWSGVRNPLAQKHLRAVKKGDRIFYYHTGDQKSVVGMAKALELAYQDLETRTAHYRQLRDRLISGILSTVPNVHLTGSPDDRLPNHVVNAHGDIPRREVPPGSMGEWATAAGRVEPVNYSGCPVS